MAMAAAGTGAVPAELGCCLQRLLMFLLRSAGPAAAALDIVAAAGVLVWLPMSEVC